MSTLYFLIFSVIATVLTIEVGKLLATYIPVGSQDKIYWILEGMLAMCLFILIGLLGLATFYIGVS